MSKVYIVTIAAITATTYVETIGKRTATTLVEVADFLDQYVREWKMPPAPPAEVIEEQFKLQHAANEPLPGTRECRFTITFSQPELHEGLPIEHNITIIEYAAGIILGKEGSTP